MTRQPGLGRAEIEDLLGRLGARLRANGLEAEIYIVGGSAIALTTSGRRTTHDIDAIVEPQGDVLRIVGEMARELGLPDGWLNTSATPFVPSPGSHGVGWRTGGLTVRVAPPEHLLAMKLVAGRDRDLDDFRALAESLGVTTGERAADLALEAYGEGQLDMHGGYEAVRADAEMFLAATSDGDAPAVAGFPVQAGAPGHVVTDELTASYRDDEPTSDDAP